MFVNKKRLLKVVWEFYVQELFNLMMIKNARYRYIAKCAHPGRSWRVHSLMLPDGRTFQILQPQHIETCARLQETPMPSSYWIAETLEADMRVDPKKRVRDMQKLMMKRFGLIRKYHIVIRARELVMEKIEGKHDVSYDKLSDYIEITITNPGNHAYINWDNTLLEDVACSSDVAISKPKFKILFISCKGCIDGFLKGCRLLIGLDGCHLKGSFGGVLVTIVSLDVENHCFPLAFRVVESQNNES